MSAQAQPRDYARALLDLALDSWTRQLRAVFAAFRADSSLQADMQDPELDVHARLRQLEARAGLAFSEGVRKFVGTLVETGQLDQLEAILLEVERLISRRPEARLARVVSAVPLTTGEQETLRAKLLRKYGSDLEFQFDVDGSLIGGIYLRVGDQVIDGSVAGKLAALRDRLAA